jgi:dienelactone hydrolase
LFHVKPAGCLLLGWILFAAPGVLAGEEAVLLPGPGVELRGFLYLPTGMGPFPAIVMMHGCSGLLDRAGRPTRSYVFWAEHFRDRGYAALLLDSFGPRGEREICTQRIRKVSEATDRPRDAYAALRWFVGRADVDSGRVSLMGWSNGGTAVLNAVRPHARGQEDNGPRFRAAVAFYPGCFAFRRKALEPIIPLLIEAAAADDWTPARYCAALARETEGNGSPIELDIYPEAHHGFDRLGLTLRNRPEVRNANSATGWGATVGEQAEARAKSIARVTDWLEQVNR